MNGLAIEFDSATRSFSRRLFAEPVPQRGEIVVRVTRCTICGSDLHTFLGRRDAPPNCVLGHEMIGAVVGWGDEVTPADFHGRPLCVGQRVTWAMAVGCGQCFFCRNGLTQKCQSLFKYGHESWTGKPTGGLSNYCVLVPGTPVYSIPDSLPDEVACPANCATATVSAAMRLLNETHSVKGSVALIVGAGTLGLTAAAQLSVSGAREIVVVDPIPERIDLSRDFGATHGLNSTNRDQVHSILKSLTDGRGADITLDFAGANDAVQTCLDLVRVGGCVMLAGSVFPSDGISFLPERIVRRMLTIRGVHNYLAGDLDQAIGFLESTRDRFPFEHLVSKTFGLTQTKAAFDYAVANRSLRVAVRM